MENYMKVEDVLRYLRKNVLPLRQYTIEGIENHFFKCEDVEKRIGASLFRIMECDVVTYMVILMKTTTITNDSKDVHVQCPHCTNCESHPIDEQRNHLQSFEIKEWKEDKENEDEVSIMRCLVCRNEFKLIWKYSNL